MNKLPDASRWTIFIFGLLAFILGISGRKDPNFVFSTAVLKKKAPPRFLMVAVWELTGALLTGRALWREKGDE